jgi:hypothetical protein
MLLFILMLKPTGSLNVGAISVVADACTGSVSPKHMHAGAEQ